MNPYLTLVSEIARAVTEGRSLPLGGFAPAARPERAEDAPKALFFAPHPDDETIAGGLALRLLRQAQWNVIDVAVTQGRFRSAKPGACTNCKGPARILALAWRPPRPAGWTTSSPARAPGTRRPGRA